MTLYRGLDLMIYFYIYSFLGWCGETLFFTAKDGRWSNRGLLNQPLLLPYGVYMLLLIIGSGVSQANMLLVFVMNTFRISMVNLFFGFLAERFFGRSYIDHHKYSLFSGTHLGLGITLTISAAVFTVFKLLHPLVFSLVSLVPALPLRILCCILSLLLLADVLALVSASGKYSKNNAVQMRMKEEKYTLSFRIACAVRRRLERTYPQLVMYFQDDESTEEVDEKAIRKGIVFAKGVCSDKLVWVFLISSLLGDLIETLFVRLKGGVWMRRSGVVLGPFSIVWGIGAVVLTVSLYRFAYKHPIHTFIGGFFLGGTYEYMASVVLEAIFHQKYWDYSQMPLNIGGRTNVAYMMGWGLLSVFWIRLCYPKMSALIEKFPPVAGKIVTWVLMSLLLSDLALTGAVMLRYNARTLRPEPKAALERYIDTYYSDEEVERLWPNLVRTL